MHETCSRVAKEGAHVHTGAEIGGATLDVFCGGATFRHRTALPVFHAVCEAECAPHHHHWNQGIKRNLERPRNVAEHGSVDFIFVVPVSDLWQDTRKENEGAHSDAEPERKLMRLEPLVAVGR